MAGEVHFRGERCAVESDGHAVSGEGWDAGGLVAEAPEIWKVGAAAEVAIGDGRNGEWALPERGCAGKPQGEVRCLLLNGGEELWPVADFVQNPTADNETEGCRIAFDEREPAIAAFEQIEIHVVAQGLGLRWCETPLELEADHFVLGVAVGTGMALESAQVVLAGGEEERVCGVGCPVAELGGPEGVFLLQALDECAAEDGAAGLGGAGEQGFIEDAPGERESGEGEGGLDDSAAGCEAEEADGLGSESNGINGGPVEIVDGFGAEEFAADFVVRGAFALEEGYAASGLGEAQGEHGAGQASAEDEMSGFLGGNHGVFIRATQRRAGLKGWIAYWPVLRLAAVDMRCQSAGMKARRMETGPSNWT